ncbi:hypothetical protein O0L34_g15260 [Tuta absoluta]|nr:hypothetical protein O0L34_g15260 [Tuta absoluta]
MFGSLFFLGLATFSSAAFFKYETFLQKGLKGQRLPPPTKYIIPSRQCTWNLNIKENECFHPYTLAVKVADTGLKAAPKMSFSKELDNVSVVRKGILCLGEAQVEVQAACYPVDDVMGVRRSGMRQNAPVLSQNKQDPINGVHPIGH